MPNRSKDITSRAEPDLSQTGGVTPHDHDLRSIARFSRVMEYVLTAVLLLIPIGLCVLGISFPEFLENNEMLGKIEIAPGPLDLPWKLAATAVLLMVSAPLLYAVNAARLMFRRFRSGAIFTPLTATRIRQIALGLLVQAFVTPVGGMALSAILSGAGKAQSLVLTIGSDEILIVVFACIFMGLAHVMRAAARLAEDNAAIV